MAHPGQEEISIVLENILSEASARGDVTLMVDLDAFQNENAAAVIQFLKDWEKLNNSGTPAPPLVLLCTERTHSIHLRQEKIRDVFPPIVSPEDPASLARASLDRALAPLAEDPGGHSGR